MDAAGAVPSAPYERVKDDPAALDGEEAQWSSGICDCFSDCRNCIVGCVPGLNFFSLAQSFVVMEGKESIQDEPICGILLPGCATTGMVVEYAFSAWTIGNLGACVHFFVSCPQLMVLRLKFFEPPHNIQPCRCCGCCDCPAWADACCCSFWYALALCAHIFMLHCMVACASMSVSMNLCPSVRTSVRPSVCLSFCLPALCIHH